MYPKQVKRRKQELKHAQDVKELYERKLERVNDLFMELNAWKLQLEEAERVLTKRERQLSIQGSKVLYKKKQRPVVVGSNPHERLQQQVRTVLGASPSTTEVLSTSPESPYRLTQPAGSGQGLDRLQQSADAGLPVVVRENPMFYERLVELRQFQIDMAVTQQFVKEKKTTSGQRVRMSGNDAAHFATLFSPSSFYNERFMIR